MFSKLRARMLVAPLATALLVGPLVLFPSVAADAVTAPPIAPGIPTPLNVLPSVVKGAVNAPAGAANIAVLLATFAKSPAFWKAAAAAQASSATAAQTALLVAERTSFKVPAVPVAGLLKVVGGANVAMAGAQVGMMVGNGAVRLLGFKDGDVCASDGPGGLLRSVAAITNGVDCAAYDMTQEAIAQANADAVAGLVGSRVCSTAGECLTFISIAYSSLANRDVQCWKWEGATSGYAAVWSPNYPDSPYGESFNAMKGYYNNLFAGVCPSPANGVVDSEFTPLKYQMYNGDYLDGDVGAVTNSTGDPDRRLRCTLQLAGGATVSALSDVFKESDGQLAPTVCPDVPEGGVLEGWKIDLVGGPQELTLLEQSVTPEYGDWAATYPQCADGTCMLDLQRTGVSCFSTPGPCADWYADPAKDSTYQCLYGGSQVALSQCAVYAPTFKPDATTTGQTYGDPTTGQAQQTAVPSDTATFNDPLQDPSANRQCFPTGWGVLNPVEWVTKPVQCALQWAFVPRASVFTNAGNSINGAVSASVIGQTGLLVDSFVQPFQQASGGCSGPPWRIVISFPWADGGIDDTYYPLSACDPPMAQIALFFNGITQGVVALGAGLAAVRYFAGIVGFVGAGSLRPDTTTDSKVRFR